MCEYPLPRSSSPELLNLTHSQSSALISPASFTFPPLTLSPIQDASATEGSEDLSTFSHDSEGTACSVSSLSPTSSDIPPLNLDTQSEKTEIFPSPSSPDPSYLASAPKAESPSQCQEDNTKYSLFPVSDGLGLSDPPTDTKKEEEDLDKEEDPSALSSLILDSSKSDEGCPTLPCLSPNQNTDGQIDPSVEGISDLTDPEQSISQKDRPCPHDDNTDAALVSPVQDVTHVKMDHLSLDLEDTLQMNEKAEGEVERHTYTVQAQESVYILDTESSAGLSGSRLVSEEVCYETRIGPQIPPCTLHDELLAESKQEEFNKVSQVEIDGTESKSPRRYLALYDEEAQSRTEVEVSDLIEIESLDLVFETSVDGLENEYGDVDAFFKQLDTEGRVYWAEPIQVSSTTPVLGESGSLESSDAYPGNSLLPALDSFSSTDKAIPLSSSSSTTMDTGQASLTNAASLTEALPPFSSFSTTPNLKPMSRSVSVQMSSSPSSHIIHRKDIPYVTDSKCNLLPSVLPLDTSTPFRAVQSWTDLQIQRNMFIQKLSYGGLHTESTQRPAVSFSSSSSFPLQSHDCLPGLAGNYQTVSVSVDTGLWPDEDEDVDRNEDEEKLWEANQTATMTCCCSCDHQGSCCTSQHTLGNIPVSNTYYTFLC